MSKQKFQIGDKVALVKQPYTVGTVVMICSKLYGYGEFAQFRKLYEVSFGDGLPNKYYLSYELKFADLHSLAEPTKCKYCKCEFEEDWPESEEESGACTWCIERRGKYPKVNYRKSCNVDMKDFSGFGHDGDWLEVTEWTNGEGIDIYIHYSSDHDEDVRKFMLSYDELEVIMNIVNKFGYLPTIYTLPEEKEK